MRTEVAFFLRAHLVFFVLLPSGSGMAGMELAQVESTDGEQRRRGRRQGPRVVYSDEHAQLVMRKYPSARTREDKLALMRMLGMDNIEQLYNFANRIKATKPQQDRFSDEYYVPPEALDPRRLLIREELDLAFDAQQDGYIDRNFGVKQIEEIAFYLERSESAILVRARELGKRHFCKYWPQEKVLGWLGMQAADLHDLGVDFYNCRGKSGKVDIVLISTSSLMRVAVDPKTRQILEDHGADSWFLKELDDAVACHAQDQLHWELSRWVSHGRICLNPWAGLSFENFDDGTDADMPGRELLVTDTVD